MVILSHHLISLCFSNVQLNLSLLLIYVDDIVLIGNDLSEIVSITKHHDDVLKIKDLDDLKFFLGFQVCL